MQRNKIIELLSDPIAVDFLSVHYNEVPESLALSYAGKVNFDLKLATQLLQLYHKAERKLPSWTLNRCALNSKTYEQSTSEAVSSYKASLFSGNILVDLTSGLGVDAMAFSKSFSQVFAFEKDSEAFNIQKFNQPKLSIENVVLVHGDGARYREVLVDRPDFIYVDPDRRSESGERQFMIEAHEPNMITLTPELLTYCPNVLIKLSPMADITQLKRQLIGISEIWVISEENEVKEVLVHCTLSPNSFTINAVNISASSVTSYTDTEQSDFPESLSTVNPKYIFEPSKALIKANLYRQYCRDYGMLPLSVNNLYFSIQEPFVGSFGRNFKVLEKLTVHWQTIRKHLNSLGIKQISIARRSFPEKVETIRKRLKMPDGGRYMLLFTTVGKNESCCFLVQQMIENTID